MSVLTVLDKDIQEESETMIGCQSMAASTITSIFMYGIEDIKFQDY